MKGHCCCHCTGDFISKLFIKRTKAAESQTHQAFTCRTPHNPILNTKLAIQVKGYDTTQCFVFFPLQERQSKFSCNFISSRGVSRIQYNIKFLACLFNSRNCKNDDRWHTELTYVLYSLLKKGVHGNFDKGRSYSMKVTTKIIQWLFGQLGAERPGFLCWIFLKASAMVGCQWPSQSWCSVPSCPSKNMMDVPLALNLRNLWNYLSSTPISRPHPSKSLWNRKNTQAYS